MASTDALSRLAPSTDAAERWYLPHALAASVFIGLALGVFLIVRRATGAMAAPVPPLPLAATALGLVAWAVALHLLWPWKQRTQHATSSIAGELRSRDALLTQWLPVATLLLFAIACSFRGARIIDWLVWLPAVAAVVYSWKLRMPERRSSPAIERDVESEQVLQQLTRFRTADGNEAIHGTLLAEFAARERTATLYVAFCPPFETLPHVEAYADEPLAAVKVAQCLHNGAQLDVTLPEPAEEPLSIKIKFSACG